MGGWRLKGLKENFPNCTEMKLPALIFEEGNLDAKAKSGAIIARAFDYARLYKGDAAVGVIHPCSASVTRQCLPRSAGRRLTSLFPVEFKNRARPEWIFKTNSTVLLNDSPAKFIDDDAFRHQWLTIVPDIKSLMEFRQASRN